MTDSRIAVGIITRDRRQELLATLARLGALPEDPRVVVVDNGSTDGSAAAVRRTFGDVELIEAGVNLGAAGRNLAVRAAATPYVAFSDDDSWWAPGALSAAADRLDAHPRLALLQGRVLVGPGERLDPTCAQMRHSPLPGSPDAAGPALLGFVACGAVVRAAPFLDAGGFTPGVGGEEALLAADLAAEGWELAYVDDIVAHHHPSLVRDAAARRRRVAVNDLWTAVRRRPAGVAVQASRAVLRQPRALPRAIAGLPWALAHRRPIPPSIEAQLGLLRADAGNHL